ncbi:hypothetical protein ACS0TY_026392 [Phlomoides rotata]
MSENALFSFFNSSSTFISRQFDAFLSSFRSSISHSIRIQFITSLNQAIALTIPILTNLLQLKKNDLFSAHHTTMRLAVSTTILFYTAYTALLRFPLRRRRPAVIADHCLLLIGNAAVASLASLLLPDSLSPFVFAVFGLLPAVELVYWLLHELGNEEEDVGRMRFFNNIWTAFSNISGHPQPILPL